VIRAREDTLWSRAEARPLAAQLENGAEVTQLLPLLRPRRRVLLGNRPHDAYLGGIKQLEEEGDGKLVLIIWSACSERY
jgi:hypothetical protein